MAQRTNKSADVLVIGAGVAGLIAARNLTNAGKKVLVVEARDRVGGRTWSGKLGKGTFDWGGQWIGPQQHRMNQLVNELAIETFATYEHGIKTLDLRSKVSTYKGTIPKLSPHKLILLQTAITRLEMMAKKIDNPNPWNSKKAQRYDGQTLASWQRLNIPSKPVRELMNVAIRTICGAEPDELSLLHFLYYIRSSGGLMRLVEITDGFQQDRIAGGMQQVAQKLADSMKKNIVLRSPIKRIEQRKGDIIAYSDRGRFRARYAVLALPPTIAGKIEYEPELPPFKVQYFQRVPMGATVKVFVTYDNAFWRDAGFSGEAVCTEGPLTVIFDNSSHDGKQPCLLAFIVGRDARSWHRQDATTRKQSVINSMVRYFGQQAAHYTHYKEVDWSLEKYTGGCPIGTFTPGTLTMFSDGLRQPIGRLHWAGTETAREATGFIEGAVESGERAAAEILNRL